MPISPTSSRKLNTVWRLTEFVRQFTVFTLFAWHFYKCHARSFICWGFHPKPKRGFHPLHPEHSITFSGNCTFTCCVPENDAKHHSPKTIRSYSFWDSVPCTPERGRPRGRSVKFSKTYKLSSERKSCPNTFPFKSFWGAGPFFKKVPHRSPEGARGTPFF